MSPIAGVQSPHLNIRCLFIIQCESPVLFPKCGNISQPDQCFHPQHGATYHMSRSGSQREKKRAWQRGSGPLLCTRCHPHPRETLPVPQMSVDNYGGESNAPEQHETPGALALERPAVYQPFLEVHLERI